MAPSNFKSDESFLQKLAVGATGATATINRLRKLGYDPIELERGSTGYKIWKQIKIKRIRMPDLICLKSGQRIESRGKTKLEISMSHSQTDPQRAWYANMRSDDLVAVVLCEAVGSSPVDYSVVSPIHFIRVDEMRKAYDAEYVTITKPKGVEEGSEVRVIWPSVSAKANSKVVEINQKSVKLLALDGTRQRADLNRAAFSLTPQCNQGDTVLQNQIITSVVPIEFSPTPQSIVSESYFRDLLKSAALSERYSAAKALRFRGYEHSTQELNARMTDPAEDLYVRLEAAAALAAYGNASGWDFLKKELESKYLPVQLETVIVLSEIRNQSDAQALLLQVLFDPNRHDEIRAGAAWALGEFRTPTSVAALIETFNQASLDIRIEAARALLKIAPSQIEALVDAIRTVDPAKRDGIAWALARTGGFEISDLIAGTPDENLRHWTSYIAGLGRTLFDEDHLERLFNQDAEIQFSVSVLWQVLSSWVYNLGEY